MIGFAHPELLFLLIILPILAILKGRRGLSGALRFSTVSTAKQVASGRKVSAGKVLSALRLLALGTLIVTLARPQFGESTTEVEASGIDIQLIIDASQSMEGLDFKINDKRVTRLNVVKNVVADFIEQRPNDRIGLVAFAGKAYSMCPLTLDHDWLLKRLETVQTRMIEGSTAIGTAIAAATNRLRDQKSKSKIIVLLTDGENMTGEITPILAAEAAKALGIKIYTIGAGTKGDVPYMGRDVFGRERIQYVKNEFDETELKQIARMTGGKYFRATDTESLKNIYDEINKLEVTTRKIHKFENHTELFMWGIYLALLILALELLLSQTKFRRLP